MLFSGRPPQYPNLVAFLDYQRRNPTRGPKAGLPIGAIVSCVLFAALLLGDRLPILKWVAMAVLIALAAYFVYQQNPLRSEAGTGKSAEAAESKLRRESAESGSLMRAALNHRRLHRDLGEPTLILLEEAGRQWARVQETLRHPFWSSSGLPVHYESIREQSVRAADSGMGEVLALFRPLLPDAHVRRPVMDFVGEAIEGVLKKPSDADQTLPPNYDAARKVVERMQMLADELEKVTSSAAIDPSTFQERGAVPALDGAIRDIRSIGAAEQELRENA